MSYPTEPKLSKWPFLAGDLLLLAVAWALYAKGAHPLSALSLVLIVCCVASGAGLAIMPFIIEYRSRVRLTEAGALATATAQMKNLEELASRISGATSHWQTVQDQADKTAETAKSVAERIATEARAFTEFMQQANSNEKATLRLEVEKLRRAETDWLQALVRMLDHVHALHVGALRSGQPNLIEQVGNFQTACRDAARRVGLAPFVATSAELFDPQLHQVVEGNGPPPAGSMVAETIATGYTFQGRQLRPALVRLQNGQDKQARPVPEPTQGAAPDPVA